MGTQQTRTPVERLAGHTAGMGVHRGRSGRRRAAHRQRRTTSKSRKDDRGARTLQLGACRRVQRHCQFTPPCRSRPLRWRAETNCRLGHVAPSRPPRSACLGPQPLGGKLHSRDKHVQGHDDLVPGTGRPGPSSPDPRRSRQALPLGSVARLGGRATMEGASVLWRRDPSRCRLQQRCLVIRLPETVV